jgi:hypothetical protein
MGIKQSGYAFGDYPLHVTLSEDGKNYELDPEEVKLGEPVGIPEVFPVDHFQCMRARAYAHGNDLQIETVPATAQVPVVGK